MAGQLEQTRFLSVGATAALKGRGLLLAFWVTGGLLIFFILSPLLQMFARQNVADLSRVAGTLDVQSAIWLSLTTAAVTAAVAATLGTPLAYALARSNFRGKGVVEALVDLPLAVPHSVAGIALLFVFGREGFIGGPAQSFLGLQFWGTAAGIVVGMLFVSAPFMVNSARIGFEAADIRLEKVARTLGASPWHVFWQISLPLAARGIFTGMVSTYARAISEIGAVMVLAYYPMTAPVRIYVLYLESGLKDASAMAVLLLTITLSTFLLFRYLAHGRLQDGGKRL